MVGPVEQAGKLNHIGQWIMSDIVILGEVMVELAPLQE
jgi:hypothetical protein